jgi:hypothetical protein
MNPFEASAQIQYIHYLMQVLDYVFVKKTYRKPLSYAQK